MAILALARHALAGAPGVQRLARSAVKRLMLMKPKARAEFIRGICTRPALRWTGKILGRRAEAWWIEWNNGHSRIGWKVWGKGKRIPQEGEAGDTFLVIEAMEASALQKEDKTMKTKKTKAPAAKAGKTKTMSARLKGMRADAEGAENKAQGKKSAAPKKRPAERFPAAVSKSIHDLHTGGADAKGPGMLGKHVAVVTAPQTALRPGSKQEQAVAMLKRAQGARLKELMETFGWQRHTVRGFITGAVKHKLGYRVESTKAGDDRVYRIVVVGDPEAPAAADAPAAEMATIGEPISAPERQPDNRNHEVGAGDRLALETTR
jgi:hypothetical protein